MVIIARRVLAHGIIRTTVILINFFSVLMLFFHLFDCFKNLFIYLLESGIQHQTVRALLHQGMFDYLETRSAYQFTLAFRADQRQLGIFVLQSDIRIASSAGNPLEDHLELPLVDCQIFRYFGCPSQLSELLWV